MDKLVVLVCRCVCGNELILTPEAIKESDRLTLEIPGRVDAMPLVISCNECKEVITFYTKEVVIEEPVRVHLGNILN